MPLLVGFFSSTFSCGGHAVQALFSSRRHFEGPCRLQIAMDDVQLLQEPKGLDEDINHRPVWTEWRSTTLMQHARPGLTPELCTASSWMANRRIKPRDT